MPRPLFDNQQKRIALLQGLASASPRGLCIFIHGFDGTYLGTWSPLPEFLEKYADDRSHDPLQGRNRGIDYNCFAKWDYLFLGYSTVTIRTYLDIAQLLSENIRKAANGRLGIGFPYRYDRFCLIGHSLGTLGIRQLVCARNQHPFANFIEKISSIGFYGSPTDGSKLAKYAIISAATALIPGNPQLLMLRAWWESTWTAKSKNEFVSKYWPDTHLIHAETDWVVGTGNRILKEWDGDLKSITLSGRGHISVKQPRSWSDDVINSLADVLR